MIKATVLVGFLLTFLSAFRCLMHFSVLLKSSETWDCFSNLNQKLNQL